MLAVFPAEYLTNQRKVGFGLAAIEIHFHTMGPGQFDHGFIVGQANTK